MKPTKEELKIAVKVLKFYNKKIDAFPDEAKDDEQHHDWSMGFMHVLDLLTQPNPENCIEDYLVNWKAAQ
jgi:hypothetical protein